MGFWTIVHLPGSPLDMTSTHFIKMGVQVFQFRIDGLVLSQRKHLNNLSNLNQIEAGNRADGDVGDSVGLRLDDSWADEQGEHKICTDGEYLQAGLFVYCKFGKKNRQFAKQNRRFATPIEWQRSQQNWEDLLKKFKELH